MADQKISQLPTITGANMADNDKFVLVDTSGNATVATTRAEFFKSVPDVTFGDNDKAIFGAGSDLQIYHQSSNSNSIIKESGGGLLSLQTNGAEVSFWDTTNVQYMGRFINGAEVQLHHDGDTKFSTTPTGINVTGTVNSEGLTVDGGSNGTIDFGDVTTAYGRLYADNTGTFVGSKTNQPLILRTNNTERMRIDTSTGQVGIGTSSPSGVAGTIFELSRTGSTRMNISAGDSSYSAIDFSDTTADGQGRIEYYHIIDAMRLYTAGSERMRIDSSGNVGIGTSSPDSLFTIDKDVSTAYIPTDDGAQRNNTNTLLLKNEDGTANSFAQIAFDLSGANQSIARIVGINDGTSTSALAFVTEGSNTKREVMRLDGSGNVGIGTSSPDRNLDLVGSQSTAYGATVRSSAGVNHRIFNTFNSNNRYAGITLASNNSAGATSEFTLSNISTANNNKSVLALQARTGASTYAERLRVDTSGNVSIGKNNVLISDVGVHFTPEGTVSATKDGSIPLVLNRVATGTNNPNGVIAQFRRETVTVGNISVSDGATAYNTSSDYRLKENVVELTSASERVNQLKPSRFNWISDDTNTVIDGFIAHEVATVVPEAITGAKDAMIDEEYEVTPEVLDEDGNVTTEAVVGTRSVPDYQGIDQSKLVPLLTAALQEALTEIASLKTRVEALEG